MLNINENQLRNPETFAIMISEHLRQHRHALYELKFNEMPAKMQDYYYYVDTEERKTFSALSDSESNLVIANFKGDRVAYNGTKMCVAPRHKEDKLWMFFEGQSPRFELDLEDMLNGEAE